jgi:DNA polymerase III epsilon subunit-like protein
MSLHQWFNESINNAHNSAKNNINTQILSEKCTLGSIKDLFHKYETEFHTHLENQLNKMFVQPDLPLTPPQSQERPLKRKRVERDFSSLEELGKLVFLDFETTGVNIYSDRIVQIGMVIIEPESEWKIRHLNILVNPQIDIPKEATNIHKITQKDVENSPPLEEACIHLFREFYDATIIGFNIHQFDLPLLEINMHRIGQQMPEYDLSIDVAQICWKNFHKTLGNMHQFFMGSQRKNHDALEDCFSTLNIFLKIQEEYRWDKLPLTKEEMLDLCDEKGSKEGAVKKFIQRRKMIK